MSLGQWEVVIGLETHAQLATVSKIFSGAATAFGAAPNAQACAVDIALPGVLPVLNQQAVDCAIRFGLAIGANIAPKSVFARKNYFYPDLPKGYQISQYALPLCSNGRLSVPVGSEEREVVIGITRAHLEEDTARMQHGGRGYSLVDFNRSGVPLMEIVTEPDLRSPAQARAYGETLRDILRYIGASNADMEAGSMRIEGNISLRPVGTDAFGTKVEVKNLNSFRSLERAMEYEVARHTDALKRGEPLVQETRGWDENGGRTGSQRSKEEANDYRYFPEPDLPPLRPSPSWVEALRVQLPELPAARRARYVSDLGLSAYDAEVLVAERASADYFEEAVRSGERRDPKATANWVLSELFGQLNRTGRDIELSPISPHKLGAQPPLAIAPDAHLARAWTRLGHVLVATLAPELEGGTALIRALSEAGCRVQIGHTDASAAEAERALADGAAGFTHLFNAMSGLDHRAPGAAAAIRPLPAADLGWTAIGGLLASRQAGIDETIDTLDGIAASLIFEINRLHSTGVNERGLTETTATLALGQTDRTRALNDPANAALAELPFAPRNGGFFVHVRHQATGQVISARIDVDLDGLTDAGAPGAGDDTSAEAIRAALSGVANLNASFTADGRLHVSADAGFEFYFSDDSSDVLAVLGLNAYFQGKSAADIEVRPDLVADPGRLMSGRLVDGEFVENGTALAIAQLQERALPSLGGQSVRGAWASAVQRIATDTEGAGIRADAAGLVRQSLEAQRAAISGVSTDEEAINLMEYQKQYQASARVIAVADQLLQTLMAIA